MTNSWFVRTAAKECQAAKTTRRVGLVSTGVNIWGEHKLLNCRMFSRMLQLIASRTMGSAGLPTPPKRATAGLPYRVPSEIAVRSGSDPGGVGRPAPARRC